MAKYILKRILISILILLGVSVILYILLRCMPTDYVDQRINDLTQKGGDINSDEIKQLMYRAYGLDGNIIQGYFQWLGSALRLDFGKSFITGHSVVSDIFSADRIGTSFYVALIATVFEFLIAIPLGVTAATHQ